MLAVRLLKEYEVGLIMQLQDRVHYCMPDPSLLAALVREQAHQSVRLDACLGIFDRKRLVAFSLRVVNRESEERNLGQKNGLIPEECVSFDATFVDPDYRGLGMQAYFLEAREKIARQLGVKYALVTVSPESEYSMRNVCGSGFEVMARRKLYGGLDRFIFRKIL